MNKIFLFSILILISLKLPAQIYVPIDTVNAVFRQQESKRYQHASDEFIRNIKTKYKGAERTYIAGSFEHLHEGFRNDLLSGEYLFDDRFAAVIADILSEIKSKNPELTANLNFYISKDLSLNAFSLGDSTFIINLGTFNFLENESELAAIISHEISHLLLEHTTHNLRRNYQTEKQDGRKQLSEIKSERYNRGEKAFNRLTRILYTESGMRRIQEQEADSLGYILFRNTKYQHYDYVNAYNLLLRYDSIVIEGVDIATLRRTFSLPDFPFQERWLQMEDFSSYDYSKYTERINSDSLKLHPELQQRMDHLIVSFPELEMKTNPAEPSSKFKELKDIARFERPACLFHQEAYGEGIYLCLLELQTDSTNAYYLKWLGIFLQKTYEARKSYTLNRYLDRVQPREQSESYMLFLNFMWNLTLPDLKVFSDYYTR